MKPNRVFASTPKSSVFAREHMGGFIFASIVRGGKWNAQVIYNDQVIGTGRFPRVSNVESWAIGLLRKARRS